MAFAACFPWLVLWMLSTTFILVFCVSAIATEFQASPRERGNRSASSSRLGLPASGGPSLRLEWRDRIGRRPTTDRQYSFAIPVLELACALHAIAPMSLLILRALFGIGDGAVSGGRRRSLGI